MELAIMNGTYRGAECNFFPFVAAAAAAAGVSRTNLILFALPHIIVSLYSANIGLVPV